MDDGKNLLSQGMEILCKGDEEIKRLVVPRKDDIICQLNRYINEIELFNPAYGLVGAGDTDELVIKHILDSLAPLGIISRLSGREKNRRMEIADAGSGAGLPGIPLAIALPECDFTLIERMGRRAGFLLNAKAVLALSNITVEEGELEKTACGRFDLVTFRAFKPLEPKLLKTLFKAGKTSGLIAAYKGKREKIEAEIAGLQRTVNNEHRSWNWEIVSYSAPFLDEERNLLVIKPGVIQA